MLPSGRDYVLAVQNPKLVFSDPELADCIIEKDPKLGLPRVMSGGFTVVFHFVGSNSHWAVRCFTVDIPDLRKRYDAISRFLEKKLGDMFVEASLLEKGLLVKADRYPIIKMRWVDGDQLNTYIARNLANRKALSWLPSAFFELASALDKLQVAHGDLQHGNIIVKGQSVWLVDYDGMYVPQLAGLPSGQLGHRNYQHPWRSDPHFDDTIDRFSQIVIYMALVAIAKDPALWKKYDNGDNLLFRQEDFLDPYNSPLLKDLEILSNLGTLVQNLRLVCQLEFEKIPRLDDFIAGKIPAPAPVPRPARRRSPAVPAYKIIRADDLGGLLSNADLLVQVVGRVVDYHLSHDVQQVPHAYLFFGDWRKPCFTLIIRSSALSAFASAGVDLKGFVGRWVSTTGILISDTDWPYMEITIPSSMRDLSEHEARQIIGRLPAAPAGRGQPQPPPAPATPTPAVPPLTWERLFDIFLGEARAIVRTAGVQLGLPLALVFPGLGHVYVGRLKRDGLMLARGFAIAISSVILWILSSSLSPLGLLLLALWAWQLIDMAKILSLPLAKITDTLKKINEKIRAFRRPAPSTGMPKRPSICPLCGTALGVADEYCDQCGSKII